MKSLKGSLMSKLNSNNFVCLILILLSFIGFLDSAYLAILHYQQVVPSCTIFHGCQIVAASKYSVLFGLPLGVYGSLFYFLVIICATAYFQKKKRLVLLAICQFCFLAFFISLYLFYLQYFVLKAFCQYCLISEIVSFLLVLSSYQLVKIHPEHLD